jgi:N-acetylneuraminate synthase/N,N'-diacetyllegionaminate synthase
LTEDLIAIKRPGTGLPPSMRIQLVGRTVRKTIPAGTLLTLEMIEQTPGKKIRKEVVG